MLSATFTVVLTECPFISIVTLTEIWLWNSWLRNWKRLPKYSSRNPLSWQI